MTSALESLRYDEDFLDVTVACEGRTIRAHKLVLSACSAYFRKVLKVGADVLCTVQRLREEICSIEYKGQV